MSDFNAKKVIEKISSYMNEINETVEFSTKISIYDDLCVYTDALIDLIDDEKIELYIRGIRIDALETIRISLDGDHDDTDENDIEDYPDEFDEVDEANYDPYMGSDFIETEYI